MRKHDFKLVEKKPMIFDSFYVSLLSEEYKKAIKNLLLGFMVGLISNLFGIFTNKGHLKYYLHIQAFEIAFKSILSNFVTP